MIPAFLKPVIHELRKIAGNGDHEPAINTARLFVHLNDEEAATALQGAIGERITRGEIAVVRDLVNAGGVSLVGQKTLEQLLDQAEQVPANDRQGHL